MHFTIFGMYLVLCGVHIGDRDSTDIKNRTTVSFKKLCTLSQDEITPT